MIENSERLRTMLSGCTIALQPTPFLGHAPDPLPEGFDFERIGGMLLGLAVGNALGNTTVSQTPARRRDERGEVRDHIPNRHAAGQTVELPSDDTRLAT